MEFLIFEPEMKTTREFIEVAKQELDFLYSEQELQQIFFLLFEDIKGFSRTDLQLKKNETLDEPDTEKLDHCLFQLKSGKPVQYVLGHTWFYGMKFIVNESVLIPRPETEELVEWLLSLNSGIRSPISVLDIGTGSGCIAISIKKAIPNASVHAIDISEAALDVAGHNGRLNATDILFQQGDILSPEFRNSLVEKFDVIVSNPPYIRKSEMHAMAGHVTNFEPHTALFVEDEDPLIFYRVIAGFAITHLKENGQLFFEINEGLGENVKGLLHQIGFKDIEFKNDISGKDRMVRASAVPNPQILKSTHTQII